MRGGGLPVEGKNPGSIVEVHILPLTAGGKQRRQVPTMMPNNTPALIRFFSTSRQDSPRGRTKDLPSPEQHES